MAKASGAARARRPACAGCAALARATHTKGSSRKPAAKDAKARGAEGERASKRRGGRRPPHGPTARPQNKPAVSVAAQNA